MNPPDEVFLERAAECERMAKFTRDPDSKFIWRRMAARWQRCARVAATASALADEHGREHRKPAPGWARH
jgi:hypothetical protein